ncbi:MAG: hypothetical protein ABL958_10835 [Bdellovibrionia bacterium]
MIALLFLFETLFTPVASAAVQLEDPNTHVVRAKIFDEKNPAQTLFTFERIPLPSGENLKVVRSFKDAKGQVVAVEEMFYEKAKLARLNIDQTQIGEKGGFELVGNKVSFFYTKNGETKKDDETIDDPLLCADTVALHIHTNWDKLMAGEALKVRMPVPARLETIGFKFEKEKDATFEGKPVHVIKMSASSFIVRMAINPLYFYLDQGERKSVLKVVGRIVPKVQKDGKWTDMDAVSVFTHEEARAKKQ